MTDIEVLVVDDEAVALKTLCHILKKEGYKVCAAKSGKQALACLNKREFALVFTNVKMPQVDGMQLLKRIKSVWPHTEVVMVTGVPEVNTAIESLKAGAYHYLPKPLELDKVCEVVHGAIRKYQLIREVKQFRRQKESETEQLQIVTQNSAMKDLLDMASQIAGTGTSVVISGESGTGKELLAKYIHNVSSRRDATMLSINCGAFGEELLTNELFGHSKGAYTGADKDKKGLVEMATGGTLFLDEITEMSLSMQVKFLRILQEQEVMPVGGTAPVKVNVRFVAATNRDLEEEVKAGNFRQDLFYRINVVSLKIPPLSERKDDIPLLSQFFLEKYNNLMHKEVMEVSQEVLDTLQSYDFPGNVRELENIIERGVALANGSTLRLTQIPDDLRRLDIQTFRKSAGKYASMEEVEKSYIEWILKETAYNKTAAAKALDIDRVSLWRKIKKLGLE